MPWLHAVCGLLMQWRLTIRVPLTILVHVESGVMMTCVTWVIGNARSALCECNVLLNVRQLSCSKTACECLPLSKVC